MRPLGAGTVENNSVFITNGAVVNHYVYGGYSMHGEARFNSVQINGGQTNTVTGGNSYEGDAHNNSVSVSGGTVGYVYGGSSGLAGGVGKAHGNLVHITGDVEVTGRVAGGQIGIMGGLAVNNTVIISGAPDLSAAELYGGSGSGSGGGDLFTGNTLNIFGYSGTAKGVQNFEFYNFVLPNTLGNGGTLINISDPALAVNMVDAANNNALTLRVRGVSASPQAKAVAESLIAPLALVNQGGDLIAGEGMRAALNSDPLPGSRMSAYFVASGGWSRYNSGSHVDVSGASVMAGLAWKPELPRGRITFGPFFEAGWGSYNTDNSFSNAADVDGDGTTEYYGGLLGRYDATSGPLAGGYVEA